jgi:predicted nucleic acid-binding protein
MIVVDTNVIAYLYLPGEYTTAAESLLEHDSGWASPILWRSEFRNILAGYMRRGQVSLSQAMAIQAEAESLLEGAEYEIASENVLELVQVCACSAYDCEFVALARQLGSRLVTMDRKILQAFPEYASPLSSPT